MDEQRVLKEAQRIASRFSFWMVSSNICHLFGYPYETPEKRYELEIKFDEKFPNAPQDLIFHEDIIELLGDTYLETIANWTPQSHVVEIVEELKVRIEKALKPSEENKPNVLDPTQPTSILDNREKVEDKEPISSQGEYITPDLDNKKFKSRISPLWNLKLSYLKASSNSQCFIRK